MASQNDRRSIGECQGPNVGGFVPPGATRGFRRPSRLGHGRPLDDPEVEAFCRILARVVLRIKGLAGRTELLQVGTEVRDESA